MLEREIGALWKKNKGAFSYYSGTLRDSRGAFNIVVFPVSDKASEKSPDFRILVSQTYEKPEAVAVEKVTKKVTKKVKQKVGA